MIRANELPVSDLSEQLRVWIETMMDSIISRLNRRYSLRFRTGTSLLGMVLIVLLGWLRTATNAEFAFASAAIIPVVVVSWVGGRNYGYALSLLAAIMWLMADSMADKQISAAWIPGANGLIRLSIYVFVSYLVAHTKTLLEHENQLATHDELTKLLNRRAFFERGDAEVARSKRYGHSLAVAFLDLDDFKKLNDTRGHKVGGIALKAAAAALRKTMRSTDRIARLGGDEFAILLPEIDFEAAKETGDKMAGAVNAAMKEFPPVSVSVGVSWFEIARGDFSAMLALADALMYEIKQEGKHGVRVQRIGSNAGDDRPG